MLDLEVLKRFLLLLIFPALVIWVLFSDGEESTKRQASASETINTKNSKAELGKTNSLNTNSNTNTRNSKSSDENIQLISEANATSKKPIPTEITYHTVKAGQISTHTIVGGTVIPARSVTLKAQSNGQVQFLAGREGDRFNAGSMLVKINAENLMANRQAAVALLQNAASEVKNAEVQYQRELFSPQSQSLSRSGGMGMPMLFDQMFARPFSNMMPNGVGGDTVLDRSADLHNIGTHLNQAKGRYNQARSQIDEIDARIADTGIIAPFPGIILNKMIETGDTVRAGTPLLQYADLSRLQLEVQVPASLAPRLAPDMILSVRMNGSEYADNARVDQIFPTADAKRRTVTIKMDIPNNNGAIPGMYAEVMLPGKPNEETTTPIIPLSAVKFNSSLPTVQVLTAENIKQLRMIRLGERMPNKQVSVISGLSVGERIIDQP